jgi:hypothetical protein
MFDAKIYIWHLQAFLISGAKVQILFDKRDEFTFPIVNFPFHQYQYSNSISATRIKIWQLVH